MYRQYLSGRFCRVMVPPRPRAAGPERASKIGADGRTQQQDEQEGQL
jgi:hypothetical protein